MSRQDHLLILDDIAAMQSVDKKNMFRLINELPEQCETALGIGRNFIADDLAEPPNVIFFVGVGGSSLGPNMVMSSIEASAKVPVLVGATKQLPSFVNEKSLVIVVDYLGQSDIVMGAYNEAKSRGATVVCSTTGGPLTVAAANDGTKLIKIPGSQPIRTAIGYLFMPLVAVIERYGLADGAIEELSNAIRLIRNLREMVRMEVPTSRNLAKQIASALVGKIPFIYAVGGYRIPISSRWAAQIGANAKSPAFTAMLHRVVESQVGAWEHGGKTLDDATIIFMRDPLDKDSEVGDLTEVTKEVLAEYPIIDIEMRGNTTAEKLLYGLLLGDYVSYYLAMAYGVDPSSEYLANAIITRVAERRNPVLPALVEDAEDNTETQPDVI